MRTGTKVLVGAVGVVVVGGVTFAVDLHRSVHPPEDRGVVELFVHGPDTVTKRAEIARVRKQERRVEACMAQAGFEYAPAVPGPWDVTVRRGPVEGSREFAERYGYGLWVPAADAAGISWTADRPASAAEQLLALSPEDREAYDLALLGPEGTGGCLAVGQGATGEAELDAVIDDARVFLAGLPDDAAFDALEAEWSACMAEYGEDFDSPSAARAAEAAQVAAFYSTQEVGADEAAAEPEVVAGSQAEIELALADLDCRERVDFDERYREISHRVQAEYAGRHRGAIDAVEAARASL